MARRKKLSDRGERHDRFHQQAKREGFRARSVFKLEEIDQRVHLLRPSDRVLDLGCAPGSWLQFARTRVGAGGTLVGIDRFPLEPPIPGARTLVGDVMEVAPEELLGELPAFDVVLSDMAPDTTGIRHVDQSRSEALFERALDLAEATLAIGGAFVGKLFQGPDFEKLIGRCRRRFDQVKIIKPEGSRTRSIEQYVVARGYRGPESA
ncbi:MAG TPA: RlmE family RNA methyltransferase [Kofleriaceae bacterium]|nr:RlmE family RNA methyltransferase [Kofleriaceae bacterium]